MAIPDHPWTKATKEAAAVRIAMTVCEAGAKEGTLLEVTNEAALDTDAPEIELSERRGSINSDVTIGVDLSSLNELRANDGLAARRMVLHGAGFILTRSVAEHLGLGRRTGLEIHIREYCNGRDLTARSRDVLVIDLFGLSAEQVREQFPEVYQHVWQEVKVKILIKDGKEKRIGRDWNPREYRRTNWWLFGENVPELRKALTGIPRYVATAETSKHRVFQFLDGSVLPDNKILAIATADAFVLGVLSARIHVSWALRAGGWLDVGNDPVYVKTSCFDPFPFPAADDLQKQRIRTVAEDLDAHRKRVLAEHPHLTLTGLYNVLEKLRAGAAPETLDGADRRIFDDGLVLILKEYHDRLDALVADAYGWPADLPDEEILSQLVALNKERAQEEARGHVRWLRPEYQIPRFGSPKDKAELDLVGGAMVSEAAAPAGPKPAFPSGEVEQTAAVMAALAATGRALDASALAAGFKQGRRVAPKIAAVLAALARMGFVASADGGATFSLRRAA